VVSTGPRGLTSAIAPRGTEEARVRLLVPRTTALGVARVVLDTDTYNEIDDQFALVHLLLAPDRVSLEAIYAAPFETRSHGPGEGMRRSHDEIHRVLDAVGHTGTPVFQGATQWLTGRTSPEPRAAAEDLVRRALEPGVAPLYVVAIGAPTNVASALLLAPEITERIVVVWLGGNALFWPTAREFNLEQDPMAVQVLFDSGVALEEIERYVRPAGRAGEFLAGRYAENVAADPGKSKVLWDMAAVAWSIDPSWVTTTLTHSPILTSELTWSSDSGRHLIREATEVQRDAIFGDFFLRLATDAPVKHRNGDMSTLEGDGFICR
jgi:purine nucleosidase